MILPSAAALFISGLALRTLSPSPKARRWGLGFALWGAGLPLLAAPMDGLLPPLVLGFVLVGAWNRTLRPR